VTECDTFRVSVTLHARKENPSAAARNTADTVVIGLAPAIARAASPRFQPNGRVHFRYAHQCGCVLGAVAVVGGA
jgi:hypothetical protein